MTNEVYFESEETQSIFEGLNNGRSEERELRQNLNEAFDKLSQDEKCGSFIKKDRVPKSYWRKHPDIENLCKLNLPSAWRLLYSIANTESETKIIIIEWLTHTEYNRLFGYN